MRAASGELLAFGDANATWAPDALQRLVARFADPQVGYVCGRVQFVSERRHEPGGRLLALRAVAARAGVGARVGDRRQRRDLRGPPRRLRRGRPGDGPRPLVPVADGQARLARGLRARRGGDREDGPDDRGRVAAQAADDEPRVADRPARRPALPARLRPALRADGRLAPAAALRDARAPRRDRAERARRPRPAAAARRAGRRTRRCSPPRWRAARATARPLLLARYYVLTTASLAAGLYDHLRHGTPAGWDAPEGTR